MRWQLPSVIMCWLAMSLGGQEVPVPATPAPEPSLNFGDLKELEESIPQGFIAHTFSGWLERFDHVEIVLFDHRVELGKPLVHSGGIHKGVVENRSVRLGIDEVDRLKRLVTGKHKPTLGTWCYEPHHGFIFYDKNKKILGHLEICFMCGNYRSTPPNGLSDHWDLSGLKELVAEKGLPILDTNAKWDSFFGEIKKVESDPGE